MPRVLRGVPSRKIPVKKPVVTKAQETEERWMDVDRMRHKNRVERRTVSGSSRPQKTRLGGRTCHS